MKTKNMNYRLNQILIVSALAALQIGCSTSGISSNGKSSVELLEASESSKPEWAHIGRVSSKNQNKMQFLGYVELDGNVRKSAAFNMVDEKALSEPFKSLVKEFIDQSKVGESIINDESISERIIVSTRKMRPAMPTLQIINRYYEVVETKSSTGIEKVLRVYALAEVSENDYNKAAKDYLAKLNGSSDMKDLIDSISKDQLAKE